jgi:hypothetical protein
MGRQAVGNILCRGGGVHFYLFARKAGTNLVDSIAAYNIQNAPILFTWIFEGFSSSSHIVEEILHLQTCIKPNLFIIKAESVYFPANVFHIL